MITNTLIPDALIKPSFEFFSDGIKTHQLFNGQVSEIEDLPAILKKALFTEISFDPCVQRGLNKLGIKNPDEMLLKFFDCNYSSFDGTADLSESGELGPKEFIHCSQRGKCLGEGLICRFPNDLTKREFEVVTRIAIGQMDAQICGELFITQNTLRTHKNNIELKIGGFGKPFMASWAAKNNLI
ncbi:LuxR C-terminal-related transcriptional regulator [Pedobacter gandavensis]|uniref:HTH luxR-type domain-containing protein n=1 Tax=Pedobacter gandavensis TaxID=2679963 RepID=A0ABR6EV47_9SPHI|nr:LuxR C-terminal-related transcriptional regulator [Pedobacter gandavensis]MBB2149148.1 hypothetical protein [Pedobacter gandavensis]